MLLIIFEFVRKPWEGAEVELEKILQLQRDKVLEDSVSELTLSALPFRSVEEKGSAKTPRAPGTTAAEEPDPLELGEAALQQQIAQ